MKTQNKSRVVIIRGSIATPKSVIGEIPVGSTMWLRSFPKHNATYKVADVNGDSVQLVRKK